tara:strand:- start:2031 stop:4430 length:2400 start_codon:yes stop_codon:yes gene_type:complete
MKKLYISLFFYSFFGIGLYAILDGKVFEFLYLLGFENILKLVFAGNEHGLYSHIIQADKNFFFIYFAFYLIVLGIYLLINLEKIIFYKNFYLSSKDKIFTNLTNKEIYITIILAAGFSLFLELSIIRIHSSFLHFFSFLKNISLISCFLGLGIGYALKNYKIYSINWIYPLLTVQVIILYFLSQTPISSILINPIAEQLTMGQDTARGISHLLIIYSFIIFIYLFNALCFVPIGHLISVSMQPLKGLKAYSLNLIGSLLGILLFIVLSFFWLPPSVWILISFLIFSIINFKNKQKNLFSGFCVILMVILFSSFIKEKKQTIYSPYQNISIDHLTTPLNPVIIQTSHLFYQAILNLSDDLKYDQKNRSPGNIFGYHVDVDHEREFYNIPYIISSKNIEKILIVGSGAGNDVAAANRFKIKNITAVEIDPVIANIGKRLHPEKPYSKENVKLVINDARSFIKNNSFKYDSIIYGLLDSQTNLSSKGGIRLDSYVFTTEAFKEAKASLKEDGFLYISFFVQTPELGYKLFKMLENTFGRKPIVLKSDVNDRYIFISQNNFAKIFDTSNLKYFKEIENFDKINYKIDLSTDDWPFIYMPSKVYPFTYFTIVLLLMISSVIFLNKIIIIKKNNFSFICFFLGAGFMLLETKCITEIAKVYGSTWLVTSITIATILVMAFIANLLIIKKIKINILQIYIFLFFSLFISYFFSKLGFDIFNQKIFNFILPIILTLPLLFSGLAFSKELSNLNSASQALSANILGAMLGGFLEYNSMYFGLSFLYYLAGFLYLLAFFSYYYKYKTIF